MTGEPATGDVADRRVLIAGGRAEQRRRLAVMVRELGPARYAVTTATHEAARGVLLAGQAELCLLDWERGTAAAIELMTALHAARVRVPVILASDAAAPDLAADAAALGASDYLSRRDLTPELLERALRYALAQSATLAALRRSEDRFRLLEEASTDLVLHFAPDGRCTHASPASYRSLGRRPAELAGQWLHRLIHPDDADAVAADHAARLADRDTAPIVCRLQRADGSWAWFEMVSQTICGRGGGREIQCSARDVSARMRSEETLRLLGSAVQQACEAIVISARDPALGAGIVFANPAFTRMSGYEPTDLLGRSALVLAGPATDAAALAGLHAHLETGEPFRGETILHRRDGGEFWVDWDAAPIRDARGEVTHLVSILRDVSERKSIERQLQQAQKMEAVGRLAGGVAHDFNNLLTAVLGYAELLLGGLEPSSPLHGDAVEIRQAAERATGLTRQLLAFSRMQHLEPKVLDLNTVVADMGRMLRRLIGEDIELRLRPATALGHVRADPNQVEQVLMNLAVNARDAMPAGGRLTIETADVVLDDRHAREHMAMPPGAYVRLAVSDTGTGMDAETRARIFEPFFTTKERGKGTGLGLSTVYGIVKQSGGYIWVYSEPGVGSTFKIYLPRVAAPCDTAELAPRSRPERGNETILLVEDEPTVRSLARKVLERHGYQVLAARNSADARRLAAGAARPIPLLLTDVVMPGGSGPALAERLRGQWPELRVLFMSGYTEYAADRGTLIGPGSAFLEKPFLPDALASKVREILDQPRAER